jgi:hypothetical protein
MRRGEFDPRSVRVNGDRGELGWLEFTADLLDFARAIQSG